MSPDNSQRGKDFKVATFAGGCFWCMEQGLDKLEGVISVVSGYCGGSEQDANYQDVCSGQTKHVEAVQVTYDPKSISYERLLAGFWQNIDPTQDNGQFADIGLQYRTVIFYHDEQQKKVALRSKADLQSSRKFDRPIVTQILPFTAFYPAEEYHQQYYKKNPTHYQMYKYGCGRQKFLQDNWGPAQ